LSEKVLACNAALQWTFPTSSAAIPRNIFNDKAFQQYLADFLQQGSVEKIERFGAKTLKARDFITEPRDTADPALIPTLLVTLLEGIGQSVTVQPVHKRIKDEVRWKDSLIPWRRSPFWLLLRVGILRHFMEMTDSVCGNLLYKALICLFHVPLLGEVVGSQPPEMSHLLLRKLCRRTAKLEKDHLAAVQAGSKSTFLCKVRPLLLKATRTSKDTLVNAWDSYKARIRRRITPFTTRFASPELFRFPLNNSMLYLNQRGLHPLSKAPPRTTYATSAVLSKFLQTYSELAQSEEGILGMSSTVCADDKSSTEAIDTLAEKPHAYISASASTSYQVGTTERSRVVLSAMWLWMLTDSLICRFMPELTRFRPIFNPHILDCLLIVSKSDLSRLRQIQLHLARRHTDAKSLGTATTIFDHPGAGSFGNRYFRVLYCNSMPRRMQQEIETTEQDRRQNKESEFVRKDAEHQRMNNELSTLPCQFKFVGERLIPEHNEKHCDKCTLAKKLDSIRIERIEKAFPTHVSEARAIMFEVFCPKAFSTYRDMTWTVAASLGLPNFQPAKKQPLTMVDDYYADLCSLQGRCSPH
jgi:hypothetical protein